MGENNEEFQRLLRTLSRRRLTRREFLRLAALCGGGVSASALLAACAPKATPTLPPTATSVPPTTAAATPTLAPTPKAIPKGGTVIMGMWEDPGTNLNPFIGFTLHYWMAPCLQRLIGWDADGNPYPVLATEVPTIENGGVSKDGKVITYKLRPNVKWADGEPFTSEDVKFTIEAVNNPDNMVGSRAGYELIEDVDTSDPLTAILKFKEFYAPYLMIPLFVIPKHILAQYPNFNDVPWNSKLLGTGPFYITENVSGDHVIYTKNPHYWEEGKPYIDQFIIRYYPSREAGIAGFLAKDVDIFFDLTEADIPAMQKIAGVSIWNAQGNAVERIILNLSPSSGPHRGDPNYSHPVLGDVRVRQAIQLAMNKQAIVDKLLYGLATVATTEYPRGWAADPTITPSPYDPEKAKALLEEAGWKVGPDGIRVKDGVKAEISLATTSLKIRELVASYLIDNLKAVGIKLNFETQTPTQLWGVWAENGNGSTGAFDMQMWADWCPIDPQDKLYTMYHSSQIPLGPDKCGGCWNWSRYNNKEFDALLEQCGRTPDMKERKKMFSQLFKMIERDVPVIYLYNRGEINVIWEDRVQGYLEPWGKPNPFEYLTTFIMNWYKPA